MHSALRAPRALVLASFAVVVASLSGCVLSQQTEGTSLRDEQVGEIQVGVSTRSDVTRLLGPPDEIIYSNREHDALEERAFRYRRSRTKQTAMFLILFSTHRSDTKYDHVIVFFDDRGVVENIGLQLDSDEARYGLPFGS
ncbi:MAG: outer membrane protein assembly factor BamE [Planctomycetes bacterium]|nr:outer membrane protein assembly factor BamE [Planctomycetota bacterium]